MAFFGGCHFLGEAPLGAALQGNQKENTPIWASAKQAQRLPVEVHGQVHEVVLLGKAVAVQ